MLRPFSRFCVMIGAIPESIIHSLSYEQQLLRLIKFLKQTVIPAIDGNTTAIQAIEEWIENVDLQEFVDKKLDEMVESGQLQEIIGSYVDEYVATTNNRLDTIESDIDLIENKEPVYKNLTLSQVLALNFDIDTSVQSFCIDDDNNVYIYKITTEPYGNLYKYNLINRSYISVAENIKLYHGNSMCYVNGKIYIAPLKDETASFDNKKIVTYDITTGVLNELNPFGSLPYSNSYSVCKLDNENIIVGMSESTSNLTPTNTHYIKLNVTNLTYTELTPSYYLEISPTRAIDIAVIKNKLYLITGSPAYLLEFDIDLENNTLIQRKIYNIPNKDDLNIDLGEIEGITILPSGLYGDYTFAISTYLVGNQSHGVINYNIYLSNLTTDLMNPSGETLDTNTLNYPMEIHVNSDSTQNLQNGSSTYPFKDINTAIAYMNTDKVNATFVVIDNAGTYDLGNHNGEKIYIKTINNTIQVVLKVANFTNCDIKILGSNVSIERSSTSITTINIDNCKVDLYQCKLKTYLYVQKGSQLFFNYIDIDMTYNEANVIYIANSTANLYIHTIAGTFTRLLNMREGSHVILNKAHENQNTAVLTGSVLTIAET